jgi:Zn-dependent protease with chaperone function
MNRAVILCLVLLATFGLSTLTLSSLVALTWHAGLKRRLAAAGDLLTFRLLPVIVSALIVFTVVLPAFLTQEPHQPREPAGLLLLTLAMFSLVALGHGIWRGWRACVGARAVLTACGPATRRLVDNGQEIEVLDVAEPIVAVIGGWRPRIVAAECVVSACSQAEFQQVIAHEAAHVFARDNLKQLLLIASSDVLAWVPLGAALMERWRAAAELEADQRASGTDPYKRVALAGALIKVARAFGTAHHGRDALSMSVAADDVQARVRRLLAPPTPLRRRSRGALVVGLLLLPLLPMAASPLYPWVHELIEVLVRVGI